MKRFICLVLVCLMMVFMLVGCEDEETSVGEFMPTEDQTETTARFREIGREKVNKIEGKNKIEDTIYYVDIHTNIVYMYFIDWDGNGTRGGITVIYSEDGTPMTLDEFMN